MSSLLKSIRFNMEDEADKELYEFLSHLPRGEFSKWTKDYWVMEMNKEKIRQMKEELGK